MRDKVRRWYNRIRFVLAWTELHKDELMQNWELAQGGQELNPIDPLS